MPGPRDRNKGSWHPSERDWALARELASAREARRGTTAWVLLTRMPADMGNASYDDGHRVIDVANGLWGVYGDTNELVTHDIRSVGDMAAVLELLAPAADLLRDTSPADPVCVHWRHARDGLRLDVFSAVEGKGRAMALARKRDEETVRHVSSDARVMVPYMGARGFDFPGDSWGHYLGARHHPHLSVVE